MKNEENDRDRSRNDKLSLPTDYNIRSNKIRLIVNNETTIMDRDQAIDLAKSQGKNIVQIAFNKTLFPSSICKMIDYSKFKYEHKKKEKDRAKKARQNKVDVKQISFSIRIDDNDKKRNVEHIRQFLDDGNKVLVSVVLAKREMDKIDFAKRLMKEILSNFEGFATLDAPPVMEGRKMSCLLKKITTK